MTVIAHPPSPHVRPTSQPLTVEALWERLDVAAPAFADELERLEGMPPGTPTYNALLADVLRRAPSPEQLAAARAVAALMGPWHARAQALDIAQLALLPVGSETFTALRARLLQVKANYDLVIDIVERDEEAEREMLQWQQQLLEETQE